MAGDYPYDPTKPKPIGVAGPAAMKPRIPIGVEGPAATNASSTEPVGGGFMSSIGSAINGGLDFAKSVHGQVAKHGTVDQNKMYAPLDLSVHEAFRPESEADRLNKAYDSMGFGPHSGEGDLGAAKAARKHQFLRGELPASAAADYLAPEPAANRPQVASNPSIQAAAPVQSQAGLSSIPVNPPVPPPPSPGIATSGSPLPPRVGLIHRTPGTAPEVYSAGGQQGQGSPSSQLGYDMMTLGIGPNLSPRDQMQAQYHEALRMANRAASHPDMYPPSAAIEWSNHAAQIADSMRGHDLRASEFAAGLAGNDKIGQIGQIAQMPQQARDLYLASIGYSPEQIAQFNQGGSTSLPAVTPLNYGQASQSPGLSEAASILEGDLPLHQKARLFAQSQGPDAANSPASQLFKSYMQRQAAVDPNFKANMLKEYNPYGPGHENTNYGAWYSIPGALRFFKDKLIGEADGEQAKRDQFAKDLQSLGYIPGPPQAGVGVLGSPDSVRARLGVKAADF